MKDQLEELADALDVEFDEEYESYQDHSIEEIDVETREVTVIKPFKPGEGFVRNENLSSASGTDELSVTVKHRPECPSCSHVLGDADERNQLIEECAFCGKKTCHECQAECAACEKPLCPDHAKGHGLKDNPYCSDCLGDVVEDLGFERGMEKRQQTHSEEMAELEKELKSEKQAKKLELQEAKQERDQIRQDWKVIIQLLDTLQDNDDGEVEESGAESLAGGSGSSFTGGGDSLHGGNSGGDGDNSEPDWLDDQFHDTEA